MYSKAFLDFIDKAKTPFHAVGALATKLDEAGYQRLVESQKFDIKLEQTEFGPKIIGEYDELVKVRDFLENAIRERLKELEGE